MELTLQKAKDIIFSQVTKIYELENEINSIQESKEFYETIYREEKEKNNNLIEKLKELETKIEDDNILKVI